MEGIEKHTCVRFVDRTNEDDYIKFESDEGCSSFLGKQGNEVKFISLKSRERHDQHLLAANYISST